MRYVVCHGTLVPNEEFNRGKVVIGFYVNSFGELLPQSAAVPIVRDGEEPRKKIKNLMCPEMWLEPLALHERDAFTHELGASAGRTDIHLVSASTTLSALVAELSEDELRLITCTASADAPRGPTVVTLRPGIEMEVAGPQSTERAKDPIRDFNINQFLLKRKLTAEDAGTFLRKLPADQRDVLWTASEVTAMLMNELSIAALPDVTDDVNSWVDTIFYVMGTKGGLATYTKPEAMERFPGFGAAARERLEKINNVLRVWPTCATRLAEIYDGDQRFERVWAYLEDQSTEQAVQDCATYYRNVIAPVRRCAAKLSAGNLDTWRDYARVLQDVDTGGMAGLTLFVDVAATRTWMVQCANGWQDFPATWSIVQQHYSATIEPLLREASQHDDTLRAKIDSAEAQPTTDPPTETAAEATAESATEPGTEPAAVQPNPPAIACPQCTHPTTPTDPVAAETTGDRTCAVCQFAIDVHDEVAAFVCTSCQAVAFTHQACIPET